MPIRTPSTLLTAIRDLGVPLPVRRAALDVAGKVVLITGGADGIGFALARRLHARGATVALVDVNPDGLAAAVDALGGQRVVTAQADVGDRPAVHAAVRELAQRTGGVDVVVAGAGITPPPATLRQVEPAAFDRVVEVNVTGTLNTIQAAAGEVIASTGHIVVLSSCAAFTPGPGGAAYMVSKAAVEQLGRALRLELAGHGATAGIVYFGFVDTALARATLDDHPFGQALQDRLPAPLRTRISPDQAAAVLDRAIARRAGADVAPGSWRPWALLRGVVNVLADAYLTADPHTRALVRDLETHSSDSRSAVR
ncbi:SDR family oxidoreductase [Prauserella halophila]|uniref:SDR family oxidoreductase n=1 Tax=Prauserella halophila TaxID=185641 RepID=A0ABP4GNM0_9PSEU